MEPDVQLRGRATGDVESELMRDVARLAGGAAGAFATRLALCDWLACVLHQRLNGFSRRSGVRCPEVFAAACAVGFSGDCPMASAPLEFDKIVGRLTTVQLEALLQLQRNALGVPPATRRGVAE